MNRPSNIFNALQKHPWQVLLAAIVFYTVFAFSAPVIASRLATVIQTSAWRQVTDPVYPLPPEEDGSIVVTLSSDRPIELTIPNPDFVRLDAYTFTTRFPWSWPAARTVTFVDDLDDETTVEVTPALVVPFEPLNHGVPVMHITCDSTFLWDPEIGIYTTGNHENFLQHGPEWEHEANLEYYIPWIGKVVDEPIGLRINGGYGRYYHQKGLRFYFDDFGNSNHLDYPFFSTGPSEFERLIIRASRYDDFCINSNLVETLFADLGHLASRYRFIAMYLNHEYWGAYSLRERLDHEFFLRTWELGFEGLNLIKDGQTMHGDGQGWWDFLAGFDQVDDPEDQQWFTFVRENLDLASYIDWQIINLYFVPGDNGFAWNLAVFQTGNHPWRFIMWDEDLLMRSDDLQANMFRFFTARDENEWNQHQAPADFRPWDLQDQQWLTMFRTLLGNSDFRALFRSRLEHLLQEAMTVENLTSRVNNLAAGQLPEIPVHADRWQGFRADWYEANIERTLQWITDRRSIFLAQADSFFNEFSVPPWSGDYTGLVINEYLASNSSDAQDESGEFDDWVELFNGGPATINLTGMYLTDNLAQPRQWEFPAVMLPPGEYLIVWCDDQPGQGPLHTNFRLSSSGEEIGLYSPLAFGNGAIDTQIYGQQSTDISQGRMPDGGAVWVFLDPPTFNRANDDSSGLPDDEPDDEPDDLPNDLPTVLALSQNFPNPFNPGTQLNFALPKAGRIRISVFDVRGRRISTLVDENRDPGNYFVRWEGVNEQGRQVPSGLYYARMEFGAEVQTRTMTLVR